MSVVEITRALVTACAGVALAASPTPQPSSQHMLQGPSPPRPFTTLVPSGPEVIIDDVQPQRGPAGAKIVIRGEGFVNVVSVTFGKVGAAFSVKSSKRIVAFVPDAKVGTQFPDITVMTISGGAASEYPFAVIAQPPAHVALVALPARAPAPSGLRPIALFADSVPKLRAKTRIPILLPSNVPDSAGVYAVIARLETDSYWVVLSGCKNSWAEACEYGDIGGDLIYTDTPKMTGKRITLKDGTPAFYHPTQCGASCSESWIEWDRDGVRYEAGVKLATFREVLAFVNSVERY